MAVGVADGVSQIEDFGIDSSELPSDGRFSWAFDGFRWFFGVDVGQKGGEQGRVEAHRAARAVRGAGLRATLAKEPRQCHLDEMARTKPCERDLRLLIMGLSPWCVRPLAVLNCSEAHLAHRKPPEKDQFQQETPFAVIGPKFFKRCFRGAWGLPRWFWSLARVRPLLHLFHVA